MNLLMDLSNMSVAKAIELEQIRHSFFPNQKSKYKSPHEVKYEFASSFSDGKSDRENNFEPTPIQWFNSDYRQGYLTGISKRIHANTKSFNMEAK